MNTEELITNLLHDKFGVPREDLVPEQTFEDLGLDSLITVELALLLAKQLDVSLDDDELYPELTLADTAQLLADKRARSAA
jgi:acyl carrier protein